MCISLFESGVGISFCFRIGVTRASRASFIPERCGGVSLATFIVLSSLLHRRFLDFGKKVHAVVTCEGVGFFGLNESVWSVASALEST